MAVKSTEPINDFEKKNYRKNIKVFESEYKNKQNHKYLSRNYSLSINCLLLVDEWLQMLVGSNRGMSYAKLAAFLLHRKVNHTVISER